MHPLPTIPSRRSAGAFSLIELLIVMAIMGTLALMALPAFNRVVTASNLSSGGRALVDQINLARQTAMARSSQVEFRLYRLPDASLPGSQSPAQYRAFQAFVITQGGTATNAVARPIFLPKSIIFLASPSVSSLLPEAPGTAPALVSGERAGTRFNGYQPSAYDYMVFHFNPDGSTDLDPTASWYISLAFEKAPLGANGVPSDFITIQIDPLSGRARSFRP
ncbi:Verru_Chthon cassette protein D [Verrucomicrobium sp. GAS474]|uniref:Verru_Chthon cassette protein D n=1 Tax=Verrucomicrobium sp. GAS474 TaxID=1882831 RepID=UPI00087CE0B9|nr:Verru_Chthon cassette protein D [Verrucomicrobium sp. GAS474]SDU29376.1 Verru_Chthon cassette protein D [Verrucomicrobium sp. GAS474]